MNPRTGPAVQGVLVELREREPLFHRDREPERLMAPDFWEVGASGRVYSREHVLAALGERYAADEPDEWETGDFACRELGPGTYLLTYLLRQGERTTRRSTIWRRGPGDWQVLYHQGTPVA
ncbi:nuclear transport factor 2 family protein [Pseudonocardia pini]|uniref:nuclear transport factor 2 family protein n=1 Tax=Pseudonocardia pini TaxID=2758030 RepID=UPI0028A5FCAC|nr:DUF4440 domain-containing protein [Pseudonocardia pini]